MAMTTRRGFTLIELLVVIGVIAVLTSLLFPAAGMVRRLARDLQCGNNLKQIALGLEAYRQNYNEKFPQRIVKALMGTGYDYPAKSFLCPHDPTGGTDREMGRIANFGSRAILHDNESGALWGLGQEHATSYTIECSQTVHDRLFTVDPTKDPFDLGYFYRDRGRPSGSGTGWEAVPAAKRNWADGKLNQQRLGNIKNASGNAADGSLYGASFAHSDIPIIRCYWHDDWGERVNSDLDWPENVRDVTLGFNVRKSIPWWELKVNPQLK